MVREVRRSEELRRSTSGTHGGEQPLCHSPAPGRGQNADKLDEFIPEEGLVSDSQSEDRAAVRREPDSAALEPLLDGGMTFV